jgi:hypothetical protein
VFAALRHAVRAEDGTQHAAIMLARLAGGHPESLDRAVARIVRQEDGRPTRVTGRAADSLRAARSLRGRGREASDETGGTTP